MGGRPQSLFGAGEIRIAATGQRRQRMDRHRDGHAAVVWAFERNPGLVDLARNIQCNDLGQLPPPQLARGVVRQQRRQLH